MEGMIYKQELAMRYFPDAVSPKTARDSMMAWIHQSPKLMEALARTGYRRKSHMLSPLQVKIIYEFLGEP